MHDDLDKIIVDIREAHKKDTTTADTINPSDTARQELEAAMSYKGSAEERQARLFCKQLQLRQAIQGRIHQSDQHPEEVLVTQRSAQQARQEQQAEIVFYAVFFMLCL